MPRSTPGKVQTQTGSGHDPAPGTRAHADKATAQKPETSVHPVEPEDTKSMAQSGDRQNRLLGQNIDGQGNNQAKPHPDTPAGQHATGSFTGKKVSPRKGPRKTA